MRINNLYKKKPSLRKTIVGALAFVAMMNTAPLHGVQQTYTQTASQSWSSAQSSFRAANSGSVKVYTTSSATIKNSGSIGGISNNGFCGFDSYIQNSNSNYFKSGHGGSVGRFNIGTAVIPSSRTNRSTSILVEPTLSRIASCELTATNILAAQEQVIKGISADDQEQPGIRKVDGLPYDPFMNPIGGGVWALLVMLAAYGAFNVYRRKQRV